MSNFSCVCNIFTCLLFYWSIHVLSASDIENNVKEYCLPDNFNATCLSASAVIMITYGKLGSMNVGKCTDRAFGCSMDIVDRLDQKCSGLRHCEFAASELLKQISSPCDTFVMTYIEAAYKCVTIENSTGKSCKNKPVSVSGSKGYISSTDFRRNSVGSSQCPWRVTAPKGRQVNITLINFNTSTTSGQELQSSGYVQYATIRDTDSRHTTRVRPSPHRIMQVHMSRTPEVDIVFDSSSARGIRFLLKYQVTGCFKPEPPGGVKVKLSNNIATFTCVKTSQTWTQHCKDGEWKGEPKSCGTAIASASTGEDNTGVSNTGVFIVFCLGLLFGIGVALVCIILIALSFRKCGFKLEKKSNNLQNRTLPRPPPKDHENKYGGCSKETQFLENNLQGEPSTRRMNNSEYQMANFTLPHKKVIKDNGTETILVSQPSNYRNVRTMPKGGFKRVNQGELRPLSEYEAKGKHYYEEYELPPPAGPPPDVPHHYDIPMSNRKDKPVLEQSAPDPNRMIILTDDIPL